MNISNYELEKQLGAGSFGSVHKAIRKWDGKTVAIKIINVPPGNETAFKSIQRETEMLEQLAEPCFEFVICYENSWYSKEDNKFFIEMEFIDGMEAGKFVSELRRNNPLSLVYYFLLLIAKDVTHGLKFIHSREIIHGDIKPANILIEKNTYLPKIVDFGLSCTIMKNRVIGDYCRARSGSPLYFSPEMIISNIRVPASDMWALGIMLYRLATNDGYPFFYPPQTTPESLYKIIVDGDIIPLTTSNSKLNELVNNLLNKNAIERWKPDQVLEHLAVIEKPKGIAIIPKV